MFSIMIKNPILTGRIGATSAPCFLQKKGFDAPKRGFSSVSNIESLKSVPSEQTQSVLVPSAREHLSKITAGSILESKPNRTFEIDENASVFDAVRFMSDRNMGSILVSRKKDGKKELAGIFTERDYLTKIILKDLRSRTTTLAQVLTPNVLTLHPNESILNASIEMVKHKFRHIPVLNDKGGRLAMGIISSRDVVKHYLEAFKKSDDQCLQSTVGDVFNSLARKSSEQPFVDSSDTVFKALRLMENQNIGAVFVHEGTELVGIFTERDYLKRIVTKGRYSKETAVSEVMTRDVVTVPPVQTVVSALELMQNYGIRNLPIIPLMGTSIDYSDGYEREKNTVIGMITEVNIIHFMLKKCSWL